MNHPYELLADLLDGTLDEGDLAGVQAHLDACPACREDVALATRGTGRRSVAPPGRRALRICTGASSPQPAAARAAPDGDSGLVPVGGRGRGRRRGRRRSRSPSPTSASGDSGGAPGGPRDRWPRRRRQAEDAGSVGQIEVQDANYDAKELEQLARATELELFGRDRSRAARRSGRFRRGATCVSQAFGSSSRPAGCARLIQARFEGRDAYIAVYLEGPGADEPPDTAVVWVAAKDDCSILSFASARI